MAWFRVDDGFPEHPKLEALESNPKAYMAAVTVWTIMGADCARRLTDGFVSRVRLEKVLSKLGKWTSDGAKSLVDCGLWIEVDGGWQYKNWHEYQPTKADVDASRKAKTERQRRWRRHDVDASTQASVDAPQADAERRPVDALPSHPIPSHPNKREERRPSRLAIALADERVQRIGDAYRKIHGLNPNRWKLETTEERKPRAVTILDTLEGNGRDQLSELEIISAIHANASDKWHREKGKHELSYVLRSTKAGAFVQLGLPQAKHEPQQPDELLRIQAEIDAANKAGQFGKAAELRERGYQLSKQLRGQA